jgi:fatty-acyl-CoA synthase
MMLPLTPLRFLERSAKYYPDKTALVCGEHKVNYRDFLTHADQAANLFTGFTELTRDDLHPPRVAFITWNCHDVIETAFACMRAPVIRVPINVRLTPDDWAYIINDVQAQVVVLDSEFVEQFESVKSKLGSVKEKLVINTGSKEPKLPEDYTDYRSALAQVPACDGAKDFPHRPESSPLELFYTSGTTGRPKGVMLTPRNLYINALNTFLPLKLSEDDVFLHSLNIFHVNGWGAPHFMTACAGTQVVMNKFKPEDFCSLVEKYKITLTCMVPTMLNLLVNFDELDSYDLSSLRLIQSGGAKLPTALGARAEEKLVCEILGSYGLTEAAPVLTFASKRSRKEEGRERNDDSVLNEFFKARFCAGVEALDCELKVVDDSGLEVDWDSSSLGEIWARSNVITPGYWNSSEETAGAFTEEMDQWFKTGDLAVVDPEGRIHIMDRKKDIIIRGGENISSLEIEDVVNMHPSVREVAVIPRASEKWGEEPLAVVVTHNAEQQNGEELIAFCKKHLASFKVPSAVRFVEDIPKSGTGKVLKRELRERIKD